MKIVLANKNPRAGQEVSPVERQTYTIEEAAKILGICRAVAYRKGVLPTVKIAGRRLLPKRALERMLAETAEPSVTNRDEGTVGCTQRGGARHEYSRGDGSGPHGTKSRKITR